ncbi:MAG: HD domain-containing protein [Patescibacteria group bacterium]|jgi:tRNA nucleotidyltransferase (CCA-adding enzyme)
MQLSDKILKDAVSTLSGKVPRALLVGGAVRDLFLGVPTKDADVEVYGIEPDALEKILRELFTQVDVVGASFGVYKVSLDEGRMLDVAIPRTESKTGKGHKGFEVIGDPSLSVEAALRRRDFTINAIAMDVSTNETIDPYSGRVDLANKLLRVVDEKTFVEDPLRVFRGVQFAARFGLSVEPKTFALMKQMVEDGALGELSKERVTDEWKKLLLKSPKPSIGFTLMRDLGIIERYYPELFAMIGTPQEPDWHPEGDVWIHTLLAVDECARIVRGRVDVKVDPDDTIAMLGAVCHDIGKPLVTKTIDGKIRALGHEEAGVSLTKSFLQKFTFGDDVTHDVAAIVRDHLKPTMLYRSFQKGELNEKQYANAVRRLIKRLGGTSLEAFLAVTESDTRGRGTDAAKVDYTPGLYLRETVKKFDLESAAKIPLLTGAELMAEFNMTPGPKIGEVMKAVESARDEGQLETPDDARVFVREFMYTENK